MQKETVDLVQQALNALPNKLREVIVLKHFAELTFDEMAQVLDQPAGTLKSRKKTAFRRLHAEF